MLVEGSCHCGEITFEADVDPEKVGLCHCTDCQTISSSAFSTFAIVPKESFRLLSGQPRFYVKTADSGNRRAQAFCGVCSTRLYAVLEKDAEVLNIRVSALRQRIHLSPRMQFWVRSALPWLGTLQLVKSFESQPPLD